MIKRRRNKDISVKIYIFKDAGNLKAYADVTFYAKFGEITIRRFKVISTDQGDVWVAIPQFEYKDNDKRNYVDAVILPHKLMKKINVIIIKEYWKVINK